jgi:hypothetical protein
MAAARAERSRAVTHRAQSPGRWAQKASCVTTRSSSKCSGHECAPAIARAQLYILPSSTAAPIGSMRDLAQRLSLVRMSSSPAACRHCEESAVETRPASADVSHRSDARSIMHAETEERHTQRERTPTAAEQQEDPLLLVFGGEASAPEWPYPLINRCTAERDAFHGTAGVVSCGVRLLMSTYITSY